MIRIYLRDRFVHLGHFVANDFGEVVFEGFVEVAHVGAQVPVQPARSGVGHQLDSPHSLHAPVVGRVLGQRGVEVRIGDRNLKIYFRQGRIYDRLLYSSRNPSQIPQILENSS